MARFSETVAYIAVGIDVYEYAGYNFDVGAATSVDKWSVEDSLGTRLQSIMKLAG